MIRFQLHNHGIVWEFWPGFFGVLALWWELSGAGEIAALAMLAAVVLHECGHLCFFWRMGIPVQQITFDFRGITIRPGQGIYTWNKQLASTGGGCLFSIIGAVAGWLLAAGCGVSEIWWQASAAAAVYSILPIPGTDGWELAHCLRCRFTDPAPRF